MSELTGASTTATKPRPPPPGVYVPAVCFFNENDDLDIPAIKAHVLRLAEVRLIFFYSYFERGIFEYGGEEENSTFLFWFYAIQVLGREGLIINERLTSLLVCEYAHY